MTAAPRDPQSLPGDWLQRLRAALAPAPEHGPEGWRLGSAALASLSAARAAMPAQPQPAAVLVPIVLRPLAPTLLLTTRAAHLRQHAGQISFPGGRPEARDADLTATALRETREETGIDARFIEPLGYLPDHVVLTGFRISPLVALLRPGFALQVDHGEVAEVFEIPLAYVCERQHFRPNRRTLRGVEVTLDDLHYEDRTIWGATAGMLMALHTLLARQP